MFYEYLLDYNAESTALSLLMIDRANTSTAQMILSEGELRRACDVANTFC